MSFFNRLARVYPFYLVLSWLGLSTTGNLKQPGKPFSTRQAVGPTATSTKPAGSPDGITVVTLRDFYSKALDNRRTIELYLPPGYKTNLDLHYKVLYANDGQDMEALRLISTLEDLYSRQAIAPLIVVAVYAGTGERTNEYGTAGISNAQHQGAKADRYEQFLIEELLPYINQHYRTLTGAENTGITGASLGGLSAFHTTWRYPALFGKVGVFSGSFWWRTDDTNVATKQSSRIMHTIVRGEEKRDGLKMWFQAGTQDESADRDNNGVIDAIQDTTELMDELRLKGYVAGADRDMLYVEVEGGKHNQQTWATALPDFLKWAFPA